MSKKDDALKMAIVALEASGGKFFDNEIKACQEALEKSTIIDAKSFQMGFDCSVDISDDEIHNIWLHMQGKADGLIEAGKLCDFPIMYTRAIINYMKK